MKMGDMTLNVCTQDLICRSSSKRDPHESTSANQRYGADPIRIEEGNWENHMRLLVNVVMDFDRAAHTPAFFFLI
jgi:hypothetical protein